MFLYAQRGVVSMIDVCKDFFAKYATFSGRTSRRTFWMTILGIFVITFVISFVSTLIFGATEVPTNLEANEALKTYFGNPANIILMVWSIIMIIPSIAMSVRRLHDINKRGWFYLLSFIPFGSIILFVFYLLPSVNEGNNY